MNIRVFHISLSETNSLLERQAIAMERIAKALESVVEIPAMPPAPPKEKPSEAMAADFSGGGDEETPGLVAERLRRLGASDSEIERTMMHFMTDESEE